MLAGIYFAFHYGKKHLQTLVRLISKRAWLDFFVDWWWQESIRHGSSEPIDHALFDGCIMCCSLFYTYHCSFFHVLKKLKKTAPIFPRLILQSTPIQMMYANSILSCTFTAFTSCFLKPPVWDAYVNCAAAAILYNSLKQSPFFPRDNVSLATNKRNQSKDGRNVCTPATR